MKTQSQTELFLSHYTFRTPLDAEMILSFCQKKYGHPIKITETTLESPKTTLDAQSFLQWYENGVAATKTAKNGNSLVFVVDTDLENAQICAQITSEGFETCSYTLPFSLLTLCTSSEESRMLSELHSHSLQYDWQTHSLIRKYIPEEGDKILWHSHDKSASGVGVVRGIDPETNEIELYCYFQYPTKSQKGILGCSGHEKGIINLTDHIIEPMMKNSSDRNGVCCIRRLRSELKKVGKVWNDRLKRIEPLVPVKVAKGKPYWYISDKMKIVQEMEKDTPTSQFRYIAGNYFTTYKGALEVLARFQDILKDHLAEL